MLRDFTFELFEQLLVTILDNNYQCITYREYLERKDDNGKMVILRHDIDARPVNALHIAELEAKLGIKGAFYVRYNRKVFQPALLRQIAAAGHEIGYHYEDYSKNRGDISKALDEFEKHLSALRSIYPVQTICMHGSPLSRFDNRDLWKHANYRKYGLRAELYLDTDFSGMWYVTDTGRGWNNRFNIRDKVNSPFNIPVKNTPHFIRLFNQQALPDKIMITIHPQRWTWSYGGWLREKVLQTAKNMLKITVHKTRKLHDNRKT